MLAERLRELRTMHHLTQKMVAEALGIDRTTYTFYETGTTKPSAATLFKLSQIYNVTVGYLMGVEENRPELKNVQQSTTLSSGDLVLQSLREDEKQLLMSFRILPEEKKKIALQMLRALVDMED